MRTAMPSSTEPMGRRLREGIAGGVSAKKLVNLERLAKSGWPEAAERTGRTGRAEC